MPSDRTPIPAGAYERVARKFRADEQRRQFLQQMQSARNAEDMQGPRGHVNTMVGALQQSQGRDENPYPRLRAQLRDKAMRDARAKYGEAAPGVTGTFGNSLDVLRHAFMRDDDAKNIAKGLALTAGVAGGVAAPALIPAAPALSGAVINALAGILPNMAFDAPEGIGQDAVAGAILGKLAGAGHPGLGALGMMGSYIASDIPEAQAMPFHSWMKYLKSARGELGATPLMTNPTQAELGELWKSAKADSFTHDITPTLRLMRDLKTPDTVYAWDGTKLLHDDVMNHLGRKDRGSFTGGVFEQGTDIDGMIDWYKKRPQYAGGGAIRKVMPGGLKLLDRQTVANRLPIIDVDPQKLKFFGNREFEQAVPISSLRSEQPKLNPETLQFLAGKGALRDTLSNKFPEVFDVGDGTYFVIDGNHRINAILEAGGDTADVNVTGLLRKAGGGVIKRLGKAAMSAMSPEGYSSAAPLGALSVVKPKGGNWLAGSVEDALKGLKKNILSPEDMALARGRIEEALARGVVEPQYAEGAARRLNEYDSNLSLNNWVEGPLTKYVKTRMASPEDEVRKLAEQGVLHYDPETIGSVPAQFSKRDTAGFPSLGVAETPTGKRWEVLSDSHVIPTKVGDWQKNIGTGPASPELAAIREQLSKARPDETAYNVQLSSSGYGDDFSSNLGFSHLIDELSNALNPNSGLPPHLQLSPEAVKQMGMEKAVRRVADINAWRAATQAAANAELANKAMVVREYADEAMPNPKGLRWVELKKGEAGPSLPGNISIKPVLAKEGAKFQPYIDEGGGMGQSIGRFTYNTEEEAAQAARDFVTRQELERQLKYEGDTMGHCVGGYCPDVLEGRSRIFSLRDAKGEPHVTVEVEPPMFNRASRWGDLPQEEKTSMLWNLGAPGDKAALEKYGDDMQIYFRPDGTVRIMPPAELLDSETVGKALNPRVKQIKGKQNRKPNDEYLPFVQDFVRNNPLGGSWGDVGDLGNTGLTKVGERFADDAQMRALSIKHFGTDDTGKFSNGPGNGESAVAYYNRMKRMEQSMLSDIDKNFVADIDAGNFASGGTVKAPPPDISGIIAAMKEYHANA